jgi:hypothetical protein
MAEARTTHSSVMAGHSRSKNGVTSFAYDPAIPINCALRP